MVSRKPSVVPHAVHLPWVGTPWLRDTKS
jgi:hypothetical protein